jgi:hypothetical protein
MFGITRAVVYDILKKEKECDLRDRSRSPRCQPGKTPVIVEDKVVDAKNKTNLGPERLSPYLKQYEVWNRPLSWMRRHQPAITGGLLRP